MKSGLGSPDWAIEQHHKTQSEQEMVGTSLLCFALQGHHILHVSLFWHLHQQQKDAQTSFCRSPLSTAAVSSAAPSNVFPLPVFPINSSVSSAFPICGDPAASFLSWITGCVLLGPYVQVFVTYKSFLALQSAGDSRLNLASPRLLLNRFRGGTGWLVRMQLWCFTSRCDFQINTLELQI